MLMFTLGFFFTRMTLAPHKKCAHAQEEGSPMTIERLMESDLANINALKPDTWNDLVPMHALYLRSPFCHPMKVMDGSMMVGIGTAICLGENGWLAHIIVGEAHRSKGIGRHLVTSLMSFLMEALGCTSVSLLASDMGFPLYVKLGFAVQTEYVTLSALREQGGSDSANGMARAERDRSSAPSSPLYEGRIASLAGHDLGRVFEIDRWVCGEDRSRVLARFAADALVYSRDDSRVDGAYFPGLGDGLVVAADEGAGLALMRRALSEKGKITVPLENEVARAFLERSACAETRRMKRMIWGESFAWNPLGLYNRIGGNLG